MDDRPVRLRRMEARIRELIESGLVSQRRAASLLGMSRPTIARIARGEPPATRGPRVGRPRIAADTIERIEDLDRVSPRLGHRTIAGRLARGADGGLATPPHAHTTIRRYRRPRPTRRKTVRRDPPEHANQIWQMDDCQILQMALTPHEKREIALDKLLRQPVDELELYLPHVQKGESLLGCVRRLTRRRRGRKSSPGKLGKKPRSPRSGRRIHLIGVIDEHTRVGWVAKLSARNDAYSLAQALVEAVERAGCAPKILKLDNDQCFHSELFLEVCHELGIDLQHGRPYRAEDQGRVERWWRTWRELLAHDTRPIGRMPLPRAQIVIDELLAEYNDRRPHQALSPNPSCPTVTPREALEAERRAGRPTGRPLEIVTEGLVPESRIRRRVRRNGKVRYQNRYYPLNRIKMVSGTEVYLERIVDDFGMPRLHIWWEHQIAGNPVLFQSKVPPKSQATRPKSEAPDGWRPPGRWRPPWPSIFTARWDAPREKQA